MKKILSLLLAAMLMVSGTAFAEEEDRGIYEIIVGEDGPSGVFDHITSQYNYSGSDNTSTPSGGSTVSSGEPTIEEATLGKANGMTVMVYLCGSNLEDGAQQPGASRDLYEMLDSGFDASQVNVLVMAGGSKDWYFSNIADRSTGIYQIGNGVISTLFSDGKAYNMGDPNTLSSFLTYGVQNFPAEKYALILWDHGGGSIHGICSDENFDGDNLSMAELTAALAASPFAGEKLDWIGFDACLMACTEVAALVAPYAEYMIASEESEPGCGWDYSFLKGIEHDASALETGRRIVDGYFAFLNAIGYRAEDLTMSCTDLSKIENVIQAVSSFFGRYQVNGSSFAQLSRARRQAVGFGRNERKPESDFDLVDLGHMVSILEQDPSSQHLQEMNASLDQCVLYSRSSNENCTGLSIYYPFYNKYAYSYYMRIYDGLDFSAEYLNFIREFGNYLVSNGSKTWADLPTQQQEAQRDNRTVFTLQLNEAQWAEIGMANVAAISQASTENSWYLVATQDAVLREENASVAGEYVHTNLFVTDANGEPAFDVPLFYTLRDDGLYIVEATLIGADGSETQAQLICSRDNATYQVTVEDVYLYDSTIDGYSPRLSADLDQYAAVVHRIDERVMTYDENGALLAFDQWDIAQTRELRWALDEGLQLAFVKDYLDVDQLRIAFKITDIFNNVYMSTPAKLNAAPADSNDTAITLTYDDTLLLAEDISLMAAPNGNALFFTARITNRTDAEALVAAQNVIIDGTLTGAAAEVYGNGEFDGLLPQESQMLMMQLPVEQLEELSFELVLLDADDNETGIVPVSVSVHMPS